MDISIVVVNYNVKHFLEQCLSSVYRSRGGFEYEVIVVDNASTDGSQLYIQKIFSQVKYIYNQENIGFARANNIGIALAQGRYILLLNPDTILAEDTLDKCLRFAENTPDAGALGVYMIDGKGMYLPESKRGFPSPWVAFCKITGLSALFPTSRWFGGYHLGYKSQNITHEVDVLSGAYMFIRKESLVRAGGLDESYFMYGEDIDLSYCIQQAGFKNYYLANTHILHYKGESTKKSSINYVVTFYHAMVLFVRKHFSGSYAQLFNFIMQIAIYCRASLSLGKRAFSALYFTLLQFGSIFAGMALLKWLWEEYVKSGHGYYPDYFLWGVVPVYITVWLLTTYISGGLEYPLSFWRIVRGVLVGTLLLSSVTNFVDSIRFSKALLLLGSIWSIWSMAGVLALIQKLWPNQEWSAWSKDKRSIVLGGEYHQVQQLEFLERLEVKMDILGFVSDRELPESMGTLSELELVIKQLRPDTMVICPYTYQYKTILELIEKYGNAVEEICISYAEQGYIIGSRSKNTSGNIYMPGKRAYTLDIRQRRSKRVADVCLGAMMILLYPLSRRNISRHPLLDGVSLISGKKTFSGTREIIAMNKEFLVSPTDPALLYNKMLKEAVERMFVKEYSLYSDLKLFLALLGKQPKDQRGS